MATAAQALGQRDAIKPGARTHPNFYALLIRAPHQGKRARFARQNIAHLAVEHAWAIHHQPLHAVENNGVGTIGNIRTEFLVSLIHRATPGHKGGLLLRAERRNLGPAQQVTRLHLQGRQKGRAFGKFPLPDIAVFDVANQRGNGFFGVEKLPRQPCARMVHIKMHHAAAALKTGQLFCRAFMVIQHHQLGRTLIECGRQLRAKRKIKHVHRAPAHLAQVINALNFAMVQAAHLDLRAIKQPGRQGGTKAIGAVAPVVKNQGAGVIHRRTHQERRGKNTGFHRGCILTAFALAALLPDSHP